MMNDMLDPLSILQEHEEMINTHTNHINNHTHNMIQLEPVLNNHSTHIDTNTEAIDMLMTELQLLSKRIKQLESKNDSI